MRLEGSQLMFDPNWKKSWHPPEKKSRSQVIFFSFFQSKFPLANTPSPFFFPPPHFLREKSPSNKKTHPYNTPQVDLKSQHLGPRARKWSPPDKKIHSFFSWWLKPPSWKIHPWSLTYEKRCLEEYPLKSSSLKNDPILPKLGTFQGRFLLNFGGRNVELGIFP